MSKIIVIPNCNVCSFNKNDKCILEDRIIDKNINKFPTWCKLRSSEQFYLMMKQREKNGESLDY